VNTLKPPPNSLRRTKLILTLPRWREDSHGQYERHRKQIDRSIGSSRTKKDFDAWRRMNTALAFIDCVWTSLDALAQRLAAILRLHPTLDDLYERACLDCFIAEELGL